MTSSRLPALCAFCLMMVSAFAATSATDLRCENLENPPGIDATEPRLSWILNSSDRGQKQTAYHILVASTESKLKSNEGDLWDSGKVLSGDATAQYKGRPLTSLQRCYWKVRVWGNYYHSTGFSEVGMWDMGLLLKE